MSAIPATQSKLGALFTKALLLSVYAGAAAAAPTRAWPCEPGEQSAEARPQKYWAGGQELWERGERHAALDLWRAELARQPSNRNLRLSLAERQMAVHRYDAACKTLAVLHTLTDAEHSEPDLAARKLLAHARFRLCDYEGAELLLGSRGEDAVLKVSCLLRLNREEEGYALLARLLQAAQSPNFQLRLIEAGRLASTGEYGLAAEAYRALNVEDPFDAEALFGLGRCLVRLGERASGLALLQEHRRLTPLLDELDFAERGLDLAPLHAPNHARLGDVERKLGRMQKAQAAYELASRLARPEELASIALRLARLLDEDLGRIDAAIQVLGQAAQRHPDARLHVRCGDILARASRFQEACAAFRKGLLLRPTDRAIQERLAAATAAQSRSKR